MNIHQLQVFLAVADAANFAQGAKSMSLSQPTASQHVAALEAELGLILFDRSRKKTTLTAAGKLLRKQARKTVATLEATKVSMERFRDLTDAVMRIGASTIPATYILPGAMSRLFTTYPGLRLELVQGDSRETLDRIEADEVELGVVGSRFAQRGLTSATMSGDRIQLVVSPDHPWAGREGISLPDLSSEPLLFREPGSGTRKAVEEALKQSGIESGSLKTRAELGSSEALKAAILEGIGAGFISQWAIHRETERGELAVVQVKGLLIERSFHLVRRTARTISPAATAFWDMILAKPVP